MNPNKERLLTDVARYYATKLAEHGETARGVDWNGEESQFLRFSQLSRVLPEQGEFSVNDLGCGYGALFEHLESLARPFRYRGWDVSEEMVAAAQSRHGGQAAAAFGVASEPLEPADYGFASGIFNVRLETPAAEWQNYIQSTLDALDRTSVRGFAFNCLTSYSDRHRMRAHLHYANPGEMFDLCKRRYANNVALLHDYGLYEFTILVRKALG